MHRGGRCGMSFTVAGLAIGHDCGCALVRDGQPVVAISEERLDRHRHSGLWASSLTYCLEHAGIRIGDVDLFVFSSGGPPLPAGFDGGLSSLGVDKSRVTTVDHHLSHAFGAFCLSGFEDSAVLVLDAVGNCEDTESSYVASRDGVVRISERDPARPRYKGIGSTYEAFTNFLGFNDEESGKTMALAAYGDPGRFGVPLFDFAPDGGVMGRLTQTHHWGVLEFARSNGLAFGELFDAGESQESRDVAAYVQHETEEALLKLIDDLLKRTGASRLCLSGGVALNCVANDRIRREYPGLDLFVLPPASDTGQPLGNALYGHWRGSGEMPTAHRGSSSFGRQYDEGSIRRALAKFADTLTYGRLYRYEYEYYKDSDPARTAAQLLAEGAVIGWFQGGSELGPRALGHRSILADPRDSRVRTYVNSAIKHREWFRPFAPSILAEESHRFTGDAVNRSFMLESPSILESARTDIAGALHVDGTARIQCVMPEQRPFHRLISAFADRTGVPAVLNTSFNVREPIVETPGQALGTFLSSELDYLVIEDFVVSKKGQPKKNRGNGDGA
ncbi:carbamoyltransferase C-terminal domain-containing protein [Streptomyces sp. NPDC046915]|uniref:carbamoyltransferase family protein n=1 Tax=Streptomyces sp. NPDC046915 TaxID=3155257 RepID=UPI0033E21765